MNYREKAEAYVRERRPHLRGGVADIKEVTFNKKDREPQLQDWLGVLGEGAKIICMVDSEGVCWKYTRKKPTEDQIQTLGLSFNLTTGQPATKEDYQAFCDIVGV